MLKDTVEPFSKLKLVLGCSYVYKEAKRVTARGQAEGAGAVQPGEEKTPG